MGVRKEGERVNIEVEHNTKVMVQTMEAMLPRLVTDYLAQNPSLLRSAQ